MKKNTINRRGFINYFSIFFTTMFIFDLEKFNNHIIQNNKYLIVRDNHKNNWIIESNDHY